VPDEQTSDKRLELAYDAAQKKLAMQDATLSNVRTRANNLLAAAALFTSFSAGVGLINTDPNKGKVLSACTGGALLTILILLGISVLVVVWPVDWVFVPSAAIIMSMIRDQQTQHTEDSIRTYVTDEMVKGGNKNHNKLKRKQKFFRAAVVLLVAEVVFLVWLLIVK